MKKSSFRRRHGSPQMSAARPYSKTALGKQRLTLHYYYVGQATAFADKGEDGGKVVSGAVTNSASAGTAFATDNKTYHAAKKPIAILL